MADAQQQLRQAYELMQAGEKAEAGKRVQAVLEADRKNINAWWMLANLLDDEERIRTCLQQVLKLNPDHEGAQKMLDKLNRAAPAPANSDLDDIFARAEADLQNSHQQTPTAPAQQGVVLLDDEVARSRAGSGIIGTMIAAIVFVIGLVVLVTIIMPALGFGVPNGNPPETVQAYFSALSRQSYDTLRQLTCEENRESVAIIERTLSETDGLISQSLDFSNLFINMIEQVDNTATVRVTGEFVLVHEVGNIPLNYSDLDNLFPGVDLPSDMMLIREGGRWRICNRSTEI